MHQRFVHIVAVHLALALAPAGGARGQVFELPQRLPPVVADSSSGFATFAGAAEALVLDGAPSVETLHDPATLAATIDPQCAGQYPAGWTPGAIVPPASFSPQEWSVHWLPDGLIYRSYLAGVKEPRFGAVFLHEQNRGWFFESTLGGRVGLVRYGDTRTVRPEGWQLDLEGAANPRLDLGSNWDLESADFRIGLPLTYGWGPLQFKLALYHTSSHAGDEFLLANPSFVRINYSRDAIVLGASAYPTEDWRVYGEGGFAFSSDGGSEPLEFQFGVDYSPMWSTRWGGAPFLAVNGHLREEVDFGGQVVAQAGWQWRGSFNEHLFRVGVQYFNGKSSQFEFFRRTDQYVGIGVWYDY